MFSLNEDLFKKISFLEYLQYMYDRIKGITHRKKSNEAYSQAKEYTQHIRARFVKEYNLTWEEFDLKIGHHLKLSADILDMYSFKESEKRKEARIEEFKSDYLYDLGNMIRARERHKENPDTPIIDEEI